MNRQILGNVHSVNCAQFLEQTDKTETETILKDSDEFIRSCRWKLWKNVFEIELYAFKFKMSLKIDAEWVSSRFYETAWVGFLFIFAESSDLFCLNSQHLTVSFFALFNSWHLLYWYEELYMFGLICLFSGISRDKNKSYFEQ